MTTSSKRLSTTTLVGTIRQTLLRAKEGHLPASRQILEMIVLRLFYGLGPSHYHIARYWRRELPWRFKTGFWTYKKFRRFVSKLNPPAYQKLSQNKISEKAILQLFQIPTPHFFGRLHARLGVAATGERLISGDDLTQFILAKPQIDRLCFKLVEGYGGTGFRAVSVVREPTLSLRLLDTGEQMTVSQFVDDVLQPGTGADYIIEEYFQQHPELTRFNASSVNTLRIWAFSRGDTNTALGGFLRVGRCGSLVDNTSRGALAFSVDTKTGEIGTGMIKSIWNETFESHKDSGEKITGGSVPFWHESVNLAIRAVAAFPHLQFAGVDIAITIDGPVVIELNVEPDPTSAFIFDRSHEDIFGMPGLFEQMDNVH
ncbi:sugar-transfer associated ATP-grasp domain-containing protein [Haliea sp.]